MGSSVDLPDLKIEDSSKSILKVDLENLNKGTANIEETLKNFSEEEIDSQMAIIKYVLKTIEDLEAEAINIEAKLQQLPPGTEVDKLSLSAGLTACRTRLVTLHTEAETKHTQVERHFA